ncbi:MAG: hypothetical protein MRY74_08430 [Neomegalonema sp.]|nr:hypothetical protein [Neomegalonema sp.]
MRYFLIVLALLVGIGQVALAQDPDDGAARTRLLDEARECVRAGGEGCLASFNKWASARLMRLAAAGDARAVRALCQNRNAYQRALRLAGPETALVKEGGALAPLTLVGRCLKNREVRTWFEKFTRRIDTPALRGFFLLENFRVYVGYVSDDQFNRILVELEELEKLSGASPKQMAANKKRRIKARAVTSKGALKRAAAVRRPTVLQALKTYRVTVAKIKDPQAKALGETIVNSLEACVLGRGCTRDALIKWRRENNVDRTAEFSAWASPYILSEAVMRAYLRASFDASVKFCGATVARTGKYFCVKRLLAPNQFAPNSVAGRLEALPALRVLLARAVQSEPRGRQMLRRFSHADAILAGYYGGAVRNAWVRSIGGRRQAVRYRYHFAYGAFLRGDARQFRRLMAEDRWIEDLFPRRKVSRGTEFSYVTPPDPRMATALMFMMFDAPMAESAYQRLMRRLPPGPPVLLGSGSYAAIGGSELCRYASRLFKAEKFLRELPRFPEKSQLGCAVNAMRIAAERRDAHDVTLLFERAFALMVDREIARPGEGLEAAKTFHGVMDPAGILARIASQRP